MASLLPHLNSPKIKTATTQTPCQTIFQKWNNLNKTRNLIPFKPYSPPTPKTVVINCSSSSSSAAAVSSLRPNESLEHLGQHDRQIIEEDDRLLGDIWKQIQGCDNWDGLLDPMNSHLRNEIIRSGEFAQACYDSFDFDPHSKYCGTCKYSGSHFFERLEMADRGYQISRCWLVLPLVYHSAQTAEVGVWKAILVFSLS